MNTGYYGVACNAKGCRLTLACVDTRWCHPRWGREAVNGKTEHVAYTQLRNAYRMRDNTVQCVDTPKSPEPQTALAEFGLTPKQQSFVSLIASGEVPSITEAYIAAGYGSNTSSRKALRDNASQLMAKPLIQKALQVTRREVDKKVHTEVYASRRWVLRRIREEASDMSSPPTARIAALSLLAKASGTLDSPSERQDKREHQSRESLLSELENRLSAAGGVTQIDVTPSSVDSGTVCTLNGDDTE